MLAYNIVYNMQYGWCGKELTKQSMKLLLALLGDHPHARGIPVVLDFRLRFEQDVVLGRVGVAEAMSV